MYAREIGQQYVDEGLHTITAEFFTEHLAISGEMSTPEGRLSDHLNGSATSIEIRPASVQGLFTGEEIDLAGGHAHIQELITHRYAWQQAPDAYAVLLADRTQALGVVLEWG